MPQVCQHCGAQLAVGAIACFRCGRMVDRPEEAESGPSLVVAGTQLGTVAKAQLLEDQWRLVGPIGRGQTGEVWHAQDVGLDRPVAVKLMHAELSADAAQVTRFEREARLLAGVEHPNLLPVLGSGRVGGRPFLVTRLLEGKTLAEVMHQRGGRVPASEAARILIPICDALAALHDAHVVHRDLKPSNVFVGDDGVVTLMDLGSAREANSELTRYGEVLGTEGYLSPEQRSGAPVDAKSDVYGVGCLLREALTGSVSPVERTSPGVPAALLALARQATAVDVATRPTVAEVKAGLQPYLTTEEATAPMAAPLKAPEELPTQAVVFTPTTGSPEYPHLRAIEAPPPEKPTRAAPPEPVAAPPSPVSTSSTLVFDQPVVSSSTLVLPKSAAVREQPTAPRLSQQSRAALGVGAFVLTAAFGVGLLEREPVAPPPVRIDRPSVEVAIPPEQKTLTVHEVTAPPPDRIVPLPQLEARKAAVNQDHGYEKRKPKVVNYAPVPLGKLRITTVIGDSVVPAHLYEKHKRVPDRWIPRGITPTEIRVVPGDVTLRIDFNGEPPQEITYTVLPKKDWAKEPGGMQYVWELRNGEAQGERVGAGRSPAGKPMTNVQRGVGR